MKKILLILILFASVGLMSKLQAQCTVSNVSVKLNSSTPSGGNCVLNLDLSFDIEHNMGNKYDWIHLWTTASYPNLPYNKPPTAAQLAATLANIGINDNTGGAPIFQTTYPPATGVTVQVPSSITKVANPGGLTDRFTITGVSLTVPGGCGSSVSVTGDVWSSQASSQNAVHCFTKGITFIANDPTANGFLVCTPPRKYNVSISTLSPTTISGTYNIYIDNGDGNFDVGTDALDPTHTNVAWSASSGSPYSSGLQNYTGNNVKPSADRDLWIEVTTVGLGYKVYNKITNTCSPLPVTFSSFTAQRSNQSTVKLVWQTSTEVNNSGFAVERNVNGSWEQIAFVPSQAAGGNSSSLLTYSYNDQNTQKGISQYRIRQIDINGKSSSTDIRAVRGIDQAGKIIVYPNPSFDGRVNVVFEDASGLRDISLVDMSGRVVKQWNGVSNNNLQIDNLVPGFYTMRVVIRETGAQSVEKIVVNKR